MSAGARMITRKCLRPLSYKAALWVFLTILVVFSVGGSARSTSQLPPSPAGPHGQRLQFMEPKNGERLLSDTPRLALNFSEGANPSSLSIEANSVRLALKCSFVESRATCRWPSIPGPGREPPKLRPGPNILTATIKDFGGKQSAQAKVTVFVEWLQFIEPERW